LVATLAIFTSLSAVPALAAVNIFLKLDGIDGDSQDAQHLKEIVVLAMADGFALPQVAGPAGTKAGKIVCNGVSVEKLLDRASVKLLQAVFTGQSIANGKLSFSKPFGSSTVDFYTIQFSNFVVTSIQQSSATETPTEAITLMPSAFTFTYTPQKSDGSPDTPIVYSGACP
jgi:type VI secretion system secreted protein Hcp